MCVTLCFTPEYWDSLGCPVWPLTLIKNNDVLIENMYYIYCRWINFQSALCKLCNVEVKTTLKVNVLQVSRPVMAIIAVCTALNLRSSSQIWWANSSSASNRHHWRSNKVEKGHWPRKHWGEKESRATTQMWINPSLAFRLRRRKKNLFCSFEDFKLNDKLDFVWYQAGKEHYLACFCIVLLQLFDVRPLQPSLLAFDHKVSELFYQGRPARCYWFRLQLL